MLEITFDVPSILICAVHWQHLQRSCAVWFVGMFRRVQPYLSRSPVGRCCPSEMHSRCRSTEENRLQLLVGGHLTVAFCWHLHHNESRICRENGAAGEPQGTFQVDSDRQELTEPRLRPTTSPLWAGGTWSARSRSLMIGPNNLMPPKVLLWLKMHKRWFQMMHGPRPH